MEIREVEQLKSQIDNLNNRLIYAKSQVESAKQRQLEILQEHGCKNLEELESKLKDKEAELENLVNCAKQYIAQTQPIVEEIEGLAGNAYC